MVRAWRLWQVPRATTWSASRPVFLLQRCVNVSGLFVTIGSGAVTFLGLLYYHLINSNSNSNNSSVAQKVRFDAAVISLGDPRRCSRTRRSNQTGWPPNKKKQRHHHHRKRGWIIHREVNKITTTQRQQTRSSQPSYNYY